MTFTLLAALSTWFNWLLGPLMLLVALFLMLLVLIQRGKGGGLSGAFGGAGGQSAFGARAGDTIMWVTVWVATGWIVLCMFCTMLTNRETEWGETRGGGAPSGIAPTGGDEAEDTPAETGTPATGDTGAPATGGTPATGTGDTGTPAESGSGE